MKFSWRTEWPLWVLIAAMFLLCVITWPTAPDRIPVHWGLSGDVNGYGGKFEGLLLLPLIALAIYILLLFLPRLDPGRANYAHFAGAYTVFRFGIITVMALIYAVIHLWIRGYQLPMGATIPIIVGLLFLLIGSILGKIRPNWFVGIRTPWTLSSKLSWTKTHRLGGWVFMAIGAGFIASGILRVTAAFFVTLALGGAGIVWTVVYSYLTWRHDPARVPPAGTLPAD